MRSGMIRERRNERQTSVDISGKLFLEEAESFVGGAELRSVFIEDDGDGNIFQEILEVPFVLEGSEECAVLHFFENFDGDAASDVDAAEGQDFEREIASFRAVDVGPEVDRLDADRTSFVEAIVGDFRRGIGVGIGEARMFDGWVEKFVKSTKTAAG